MSCKFPFFQNFFLGKCERSIENGTKKTRVNQKNAEKGNMPKKGRHFENLAKKAKKAKKGKKAKIRSLFITIGCVKLKFIGKCATFSA